MEKFLIIDERAVGFKSTAAFLIRYKAQFHRDALKDIYKLNGVVNADGSLGDIELLDMEVFYNLIWTLAKTFDKSIPAPMEWLDTFSEFPLAEILPELTEMIFSSLGSTVESKKK